VSAYKPRIRSCGRCSSVLFISKRRHTELDSWRRTDRVLHQDRVGVVGSEIFMAGLLGPRMDPGVSRRLGRHPNRALVTTFVRPTGF